MKSKVYSLFILMVSHLLLASLAQARISPDEALEVNQALVAVSAAALAKTGERLVVNAPLFGMDPAQIALAHASYTQTHDGQGLVHEVTAFGGLWALASMTRETYALIICHELGHGMGGEPHKEISAFQQDISSVEGQADYYATSVCLPKVLSKLGLKVDFQRAIGGFREFMIETGSATRDDFALPDLSSPERVITKADHYPSPSCRIATFWAGANGEARPRCWYAP